MEPKLGWYEKFLKVVNIAGTYILMNLMFCIGCLGIVTIGQSFCGLVSAIRYNIRGDSWFAGYKFGFKKRFWRGTIAWCVMLAVNIYMLFDVNHALYQDAMVPLVAACVMLALTTMLTTSLLMLNVYIPTKAGDWVRNAVNMIFKSPLQLLASAVLCWLPVLLALFWFGLFYQIALIFVAVYFALAAVVSTMLLKKTLIDYLVEARANGTLTAEEGSRANDEEENEE